MATIFTHIFDGDIPGTFVWQDDRCGAFMSINPLRRGHVLVAPRDEIDHWLDAPPELRARTREAIVGVARERYSWDGVARTVLAAAQGRLDDLPRP